MQLTNGTLLQGGKYKIESVLGQGALRTLLNLQMVTYRQEGRTKVYSVSDRFLQMWIVKKY